MDFSGREREATGVGRSASERREADETRRECRRHKESRYRDSPALFRRQGLEAPQRADSQSLQETWSAQTGTSIFSLASESPRQSLGVFAIYYVQFKLYYSL